MQERKIISFLGAGLAHRYLPGVLAVAAFVIMLGALRTGLMWDDLFHRAVLTDRPQLPKRLYDTGMVPEDSDRLTSAVANFFTMARSSSDVRKARDYGVVPWWTHDNFRCGFWKPVSALTHWLDYRVFVNSPALMHAHSLLWFAVVIFLVTVLYRRLIGPAWAAGLAALFYLLDESNYFPAMFIANRNVWLALAFGIGAVLAHHRWRSSHSPYAAVSAGVCLLASLLSAEAGIATFAYLFAYALFLDDAKPSRRVLSLAPSLVLIVLWRLVYNALDYGVYGSGMYIDPVREPLRYAAAVVERAPLLLMGQWSWQSPDLLLFANDAVKSQAWFAAVILLALVFVMLLPLLINSRVARFWFTAMILCVLPICALTAVSRNLLFVSIAAFALTAQFMSWLLKKESLLPKSHLWRAPAWAFCLMLVIIHLPMAAAARAVSPRMIAHIFKENMERTTNIGSPDGLDDKDVVIVNAPNPVALLFIPFDRAYRQQPIPQSVRMLAPGFGPLEVVRTDEKSLVIKTQSDNLFSADQQSYLHVVHFLREFNKLFRNDRLGFRPGERTILTGLSVEVLAVDGNGQPTEVSFQFDVPLEDTSLHWLQFDWQTGRYGPFKPPPVGENTEIPGPPPVPFDEWIRGMAQFISGR